MGTQGDSGFLIIPPYKNTQSGYLDRVDPPRGNTSRSRDRELACAADWGSVILARMGSFPGYSPSVSAAQLSYECISTTGYVFGTETVQPVFMLMLKQGIAGNPRDWAV